jgi:hypothetical protein
MPKMPKRYMTLIRRINQLVHSRRIPSRFRVADVLDILAGDWSDNFIKTAPANFCEGTGNYVQRGAKARFRRIQRGLYELA